VVAGGLYCFFYGCCNERGEQKGGEPWLDGGMGKGSACTRWLGHRREGMGQRGQEGQSKELSRAVMCLSWVHGRSISHLHREFAYF